MCERWGRERAKRGERKLRGKERGKRIIVLVGGYIFLIGCLLILSLFSMLVNSLCSKHLTLFHELQSFFVFCSRFQNMAVIVQSLV